MAMPACYGEFKQMSVTGSSGLYPLVNSEAGLSLSEADYQRAGVQGLVYSLLRLLMRPGMQALNALENWRSASIWNGPVIIDASDLSIEPHSEFINIRNIYDGSHQNCSLQEIMTLLKKLQIDAVLWPGNSFQRNEWDDLYSQIPFYCKDSDEQYRPMTTRVDEGKISEFTKTFSIQKDAIPAAGVITDMPVKDALQGLLYISDGVLDIREEQWTHIHSAIEAECLCYSCAAGFTRAYFHHLYEHTPLLCHRLLAMHNLHFAQRMFS